MVKLNGSRSGDDVTGYVAYFKLRNGFEKYLYMDRGSIERHAKRYSKSYGNDRSAWTTNFDDMGKKTVLRLLLGKYGLLSIEMQDSDAKIPELGGDPRLTEMPSFDDILDGEFADAKAELPAAPEGTDDLTPAIVAAAIKAMYTENEHSARETLKYCKTHFESVDQGVAWFKTYRWAKDLGGNTEQAAEAANNGEAPA
jgi:RecT family